MSSYYICTCFGLQFEYTVVQLYFVYTSVLKSNELTARQIFELIFLKFNQVNHRINYSTGHPARLLSRLAQNIHKIVTLSRLECNF
jgi:hypothetical protein